MAIDVVAFSTEGHRLLMACALSPADIARKADVPRQRVSQWRTGRSRPSGEARQALERAIGISATSWDSPPVAQPGTPKGTIPPSPPVVDGAPVDVDALDSAPAAELEGLGLAGLEGVVARLRELAPTLPPRERVQAIAAEGRIHTTIVNVRAREADARGEYLASEDFAQDVRLLVAAVPASAAQVRTALGRLGVDLPPPPVQTSPTVQSAPRHTSDVERILVELQVAEGWRAKGEMLLAASHVVGLAIDVHADEIAEVVAPHPELAGRLLAALDPADEQIVSAALERRIALADALKLPPPSRKVMADLLEAHGLVDVAATVAGGSP